MKYLLVLGVVLFAIWLWRHNRATDARNQEAQRPPPKTPPPAVSNMVVCAHCGVHLPQPDAVAGQRGQYCSQAHRQAHEG
ncbi:MAG: hypothetical protein C0445_01130 [Polaromonas sp.]|nr:hypothetical protein [Polaromonas sp.]